MAQPFQQQQSLLTEKDILQLQKKQASAVLIEDGHNEENSTAEARMEISDN